VRDPDSARTLERLTGGPDETRALAARLGERLAAGDVVLLEGGLGAGKTVFVQGLARGLGLGSPVKSPTFTLVHEYRAAAPGRRPACGLAHLDLYRIPEGRGIDDLGLDELLERGAVAVEWGGRLAAVLAAFVQVTIDGPDPARPADERRLRFAGTGERGRALVEGLAGAATGERA
jgi:tRNA threonylcarbamoyladenosine biosynthesis protein TsaE